MSGADPPAVSWRHDALDSSGQPVGLPSWQGSQFDDTSWRPAVEILRPSSRTALEYLGQYGLALLREQRGVEERFLVAKPAASGWGRPKPLAPFREVPLPIQIAEARPGDALIAWIDGSPPESRLRTFRVRYVPRSAPLPAASPSTSTAAPATAG